MACSRCKNSKWNGHFPICDQCEACRDCLGLGRKIEANREVLCKNCSGRGWLKTAETQKAAEGAIQHGNI